MNRPILIDLRNIYRIEDVRKQGFEYISVGKTIELEMNTSATHETSKRSVMN
jgi:hypothetical protein